MKPRKSCSTLSRLKQWTTRKSCLIWLHRLNFSLIISVTPGTDINITFCTVGHRCSMQPPPRKVVDQLQRWLHRANCIAPTAVAAIQTSLFCSMSKYPHTMPAYHFLTAVREFGNGKINER